MRIITYKHKQTGEDLANKIEETGAIDAYDLQNKLSESKGEDFMNKLMICEVADYLPEWDEILTDLRLKLEYDPA